MRSTITCHSSEIEIDSNKHVNVNSKLSYLYTFYFWLCFVRTRCSLYYCLTSLITPYGNNTMSLSIQAMWVWRTHMGCWKAYISCERIYLLCNFCNTCYKSVVYHLPIIPRNTNRFCSQEHFNCFYLKAHCLDSF